MKVKLVGHVASSPGHSQILSRSHGEKPRLRDKIWEWPGNEAIGHVGESIKVWERATVAKAILGHRQQERPDRSD